MYKYIHTHTNAQERASISNNKAGDGAGIHVDGGYVTLRDSVSMTHNTASGYLGGGALFLRDSTLVLPDANLSSVTLQNNRGKSGAYQHTYTLRAHVPAYASRCEPLGDLSE